MRKFPSTAHKELRLVFRNDIFALLESGVVPEALANEARVTVTDLDLFLRQGTPDNEWVPGFEFDPRTFCRLNNIVKEMIRKTNRRIEQEQGSSIKN